MKNMMSVVIALMFVGTAVGQVNTTSTCNVYGNTVSCRSTSTDVGARQAEQQRQAYESGRTLGEGIGNLIAHSRASGNTEKDNEVQVVYCQKNPNGFGYDGGQRMACSDMLAHARAYCTIHKKYKACKLLVDQPVAPVQQAVVPKAEFSAVIPNWLCPSKDSPGAFTLCPNAKELIEAEQAAKRQ